MLFGLKCSRPRRWQAAELFGFFKSLIGARVGGPRFDNRTGRMVDKGNVKRPSSLAQIELAARPDHNLSSKADTVGARTSTKHTIAFSA